LRYDCQLDPLSQATNIDATKERCDVTQMDASAITETHLPFHDRPAQRGKTSRIPRRLDGTHLLPSFLPNKANGVTSALAARGTTLAQEVSVKRTRTRAWYENHPLAGKKKEEKRFCVEWNSGFSVSKMAAGRFLDLDGEREWRSFICFFFGWVSRLVHCH